MIRAYVRVHDDSRDSPAEAEVAARARFAEFTQEVRVSKYVLRAVVEGTDIEFVIFADRPYTVAALIRPEDWEALRLLNEWLGPAPMTRDGAIPILELVTEEIVV